jgi:hypothetical protein
VLGVAGGRKGKTYVMEGGKIRTQMIRENISFFYALNCFE